jgi:hypothetical protein
LAQSFRNVSPSWQGGHGRKERFTSLELGSREKGIQEGVRAGYSPKDTQLKIYFLQVGPISYFPPLPNNAIIL